MTALFFRTWQALRQQLQIASVRWWAAAVLALLVLALLLAAALLHATRGDAAEPVASRAAQPAQRAARPRGNLATVGAFGTIQPRSRVITVSHDGGFEGVRIEKVLVEEGDKVEAGQVLATFSDR